MLKLVTLSFKCVKNVQEKRVTLDNESRIPTCSSLVPYLSGNANFRMTTYYILYLKIKTFKKSVQCGVEPVDHDFSSHNHNDHYIKYAINQ